MAIILPGARYTIQGALIGWSVRILAERGWRVQAVEWAPTEADLAAPGAFVERGLELALDAVGPRPALVVAKPLGTYALGWAVREEIPGIWLTPLLTVEEIALALEEAPASHLAIGGDQDPYWRPDRLGGGAAQIATVAGGDHSLALRAGWRASLEAHRLVFERIDSHIAALAHEGHPHP